MSSSNIDIKERIIDYIKRNRVSSTEVADCLQKNGSIPGVSPVNRGHFVVGDVHWVYAYGETNWHVHEQIQNVKERDIVLVEEFECKGRAIFGDLVSKYLLLYRQVSGIVVVGKLRDAPRIIKENWAVWCTGFNPVGCFNESIDNTLSQSIQDERRERYNRAIAVCDDTGVVVIPREHHTEEFLGKLEAIEEQEDIWAECINRKKWSTFETVCLKKYLEE